MLIKVWLAKDFKGTAPQCIPNQWSRADYHRELDSLWKDFRSIKPLWDLTIHGRAEYSKLCMGMRESFDSFGMRTTATRIDV